MSEMTPADRSHGAAVGDLLATALAAHGGLDRWRQFDTIELDVSIGGALWDLKGQTGLFADTRFRADTQRQSATLDIFGDPARRLRFSPDQVSLEQVDGTPIQLRNHPRDAFLGHTAETPWDLLHAGYFTAYALWTYAMQPFVYAREGFRTEELDPWTEAGETWRRLKVTFPDTVASHTREQVTYFGPDGLMRRHDYAVDVLGGATGAQYIDDYRDIQGLMMPHRRRVYPLGADNHPNPEPVLVSIDIRQARFDPA
jgi:hypothetical protein